MRVDLERIKENQLKFLAALYEIAADHVAKENTPGGVTFVAVFVVVIGGRAGLTRQESDQICMDLMQADLVEGRSGGGVNGLRLNLTPRGKQLAEEYLYEKTSLAKRRKLWAWLKEQSASGAGSILKQAGKWLCVTVIGASLWPVVKKWVKEWICIK